MRYLFIIILLLTIVGISFGCKKDNANQNPEQIMQPVERIVDIGNDKISCKIYGKGFPLIMCMGYSGTMEMWQADVVKKLSEEYQVILFDYPGIGLSTTLDTAMSMKSMAGDAAKLLNTLGIEKAHVLGWSMGTNVSLELVLAFPSLVEKLVLYAGDCGDTIAIPPPDSVAQVLADTGASPEELFKILFPPAWLINHDPFDYFPDITYGPDPETVEMQWAAFEKWNLPGGGAAERLNDIMHETLLITGDEDICTPTANSFILKDAIVNATLIEVHGAGHGLMYQEPQKFVNYVIAFLNNNTTSSPARIN